MSDKQDPNENGKKPPLVAWLGDGEKPPLVRWFEKNVGPVDRLVELDGWEPYEDVLRNLERDGKLRVVRINGRVYSTRASIRAFLKDKSTEAIDSSTPNELEGQEQHE